MIKGIFLILLFLFLGETGSYLIDGIIPGSVLGMVFLFLSLKMRIVKIEDVRAVANFLTKYMALFFVPASIGIMTSWELISPHWFALTIIAVSTTVLVIAVVGLIQEHGGRSSQGKIETGNHQTD